MPIRSILAAAVLATALAAPVSHAQATKKSPVIDLWTRGTVAFGVYADQASLDDGWQNQIIFPLNVNVLESDEFLNYEVPFFNGQQANKDVYVPAANAYEGMTYTPIGQYYYSQLTEQIARINEGSATGSEAADALQEAVVAYAEEQGFTVE